MTDNELIYTQSVIDDANKALLNIPGVVSVGITHSYITGIGNEYQILVYIKDESVISSLPNNVHGMRVVYTVVGELTTMSFVRRRYGDVNTVQSLQKGRYRPVIGGVSGGLYGTQITSTGTIGCIAKEAGGSKRTVLVSNNHVFVFDIGALSGKGSKGDPIIQPGYEDGGTVNDKVAAVEKWLHINAMGNEIDGAYSVAVVDTATPNICGLYTGPSVDPVIGMAVKKAGRTTGCVNGTIESINTACNTKYTDADGNIFIAQFTNCFTTVGSGPVSQLGDSGSVWVTAVGNNIVGLNYAGTSSGASVSCRAKKVESLLGVVFGDGEGGDGGCTTPTVNLIVSSSGGGGNGGGVIKHYKCNAQGWCEEDPTGTSPYTENTCGGTCTPAVRFTCATLPDGTKYCKSDVNGEFATLTECHVYCTTSTLRYTCKTTGTTKPIKYCSISPTGEFATRLECENVCK